MANLVELIKMAALEAVRAQKPMALRLGNVVNCHPFCVKIDGKTLLTKEFLYISDGYFNRAKVGDRVLVLSCQGGQKFLVLDKVVTV